MKQLIIAAVLAWAVAFQVVCAENSDWHRMTVRWMGKAPSEKVIIRDQKTWEAMWTKRIRSLDFGSQQAPEVDFSRDVVIGVFNHDTAPASNMSAGTGRLDGTSRDIRPESTVGVLELSRISLADFQSTEGFRDAAASDRIQLQESSRRIWMAMDAMESSSLNGAFDGLRSHDHGAMLSGSDIPASVNLRGDSRLAMATPAVLQPYGSNTGRTELKSAAGVFGIEKVAAKCTPGVDCPDEQPNGGGAKCTPGVDCPNDGGARCTPGVDCSGDGGGSGRGGRTPTPPNYRRRPNTSPRTPPPSRDIPYDDGRADIISGYWRPYVDSYGRSLVDHGSWQERAGSRGFSRGGSQSGAHQETAYEVRLKSTPYRNKRMLYWRWVGRDCNSDYSEEGMECVYWDPQYRWFFEGTEEGRSQFIDVLVEFESDKPLLPWEREEYSLSFSGGRVELKVSGAAYEYSQEGPIIDQARDLARITLRPGKKRLTQPESKAVTMSLVNNGGKLQLVIEDSRVSYYAGETLEVTVKVKYDKPWSISNPVIFERSSTGPLRIVVQSGQPKQIIDVTGARSKGEYWVDSWSFRRANSKISSGDWIYRGSGNKVWY